MVRLAKQARARVGDILRRVIMPDWRDRWEVTSGTKITPNSTLSTLRAALDGDLTAQHGVFWTMEESWPRLAKNMFELRSAAARASYTVTPHYRRGEDPIPQAQEKADFVEAVFDAWRGDAVTGMAGLQRFVFDLTDAIGKGLSVQELMWERGAGNALEIIGSYWVHPQYYGLARGSNELRLFPSTTQGAELEFPPHKFVTGVFHTRSGNPVGNGFFRPLAWWWSAMMYGREWMLNHAQMFGIPIRVGKYDPGAVKDSELSAVEAMMEGLGSAGWALFPTGVSVELLQAQARASSTDPQEQILALADKLCDILILGQTLTTDVGDSGSRALGDVHQGIRGERLMQAADWVADIINDQVIPSLVFLNYGNTEDCPYVIADRPDGQSAIDKATRDTALLNAGVQMPRAWFYNRHDIPMPEEGEDVIEHKAPEPSGFPGMFGASGAVVHARETNQPSQRDTLLRNVLEDVTGVSEAWLAPVKPAFQRLLNLAASDRVTDADFVMALERARDEMPELFDQIDVSSLQKAMEAAMGAAVVNGALDKGMPPKEAA